jgi:hypothetical protein
MRNAWSEPEAQPPAQDAERRRLRAARHYAAVAEANWAYREQYALALADGSAAK